MKLEKIYEVRVGNKRHSLATSYTKAKSIQVSIARYYRRTGEPRPVYTKRVQ